MSREAPETRRSALRSAVRRLALPAEAFETYFHRLLMTLGGWAQYARYRLWQAELDGGSDATIADLLAIRLIWESALFDRYEDRIGARWKTVVAAHAAPVAPTADHVVDAILQEAAERAAQRALGRHARGAGGRGDGSPARRSRPHSASTCAPKCFGGRWNR